MDIVTNALSAGRAAVLRYGLKTAPCLALLLLFSPTDVAAAQAPALPELTAPVNDFAHVIPPDKAAAISAM